MTQTATPAGPLAGRVAVITGSARRMGRAIAMELARDGAAVVINGVSDEARARATAQEIIDAGGRAIHCMADVTREEDAARLIQSAIDAFGRLDILISVPAPRGATPIEQMSFAEWKHTLEVVLDGAFLTIRAAAPHIRNSPAGRIITIGGQSAFRGAKGRVHVSAAKGALVGMTRTLANEFGGAATVNCVAPGTIVDDSDSPEATAERMKRVPVSEIPMGRPGRISDITAMIAFLCSDRGGYVSGQTIHVGGGSVMP